MSDLLCDALRTNAVALQEQLDKTHKAGEQDKRTQDRKQKGVKHSDRVEEIARLLGNSAGLYCRNLEIVEKFTEHLRKVSNTLESTSLSVCADTYCKCC